jgi:hypothetical protein
MSVSAVRGAEDAANDCTISVVVAPTVVTKTIQRTFTRKHVDAYTITRSSVST